MENFQEYIKQSRTDFVNAINKQDWNTELRTAAEDILIAYDQMDAQLNKLPAPKQRSVIVVGGSPYPKFGCPFDEPQQKTLEIINTHVKEPPYFPSKGSKYHK